MSFAISSSTLACQCIVDQKDDDLTGSRDKHAVDVQPCNAFLKRPNRYSPTIAPHDPKQDVEQEILALPVHSAAPTAAAPTAAPR